MFIETSGECAMYFDQEARCVTDTTVASYLEKKEHKCLKNAYCLSVRSSNDVKNFSQTP